MKASQIFELATALIQERVGEDPDTKFFTPFFMTIALQESLDAENAYRKVHGIEPIEAITPVKSTEEEIPFVNPGILLRALPYALVSHYYRDNNDQYHEQLFRMEFVNAVNESTPFIIGTVEDVYS